MKMTEWTDKDYRTAAKMIVAHAGLDAARGERVAVREIERAISDGADRDRLEAAIGGFVKCLMQRM